MTNGFRKELMTEEEFSLFRELIRKEFGLMLNGDKRLTFHTRVSHRLTILGLSDYREYYDFILSDSSREELYILASHITNNETYFFREKAQLDLFSELLKEIKIRKQDHDKTIKIVSFASSSGEEVYSINIVVQESGLFLWDWDIRVTGLDIDKTALIKAVSASYTKNSFRVVNGDAELIRKYFAVEGERYILRRSMAKNVEFLHGNIVDNNAYSGMGPVDVIFCRNVLIYMDDEAIDRVVKNFYNVLSDKGYLFIGSSESLIQKTNLFIPEYNNGVIVYKKNRNISR